MMTRTGKIIAVSAVIFFVVVAVIAVRNISTISENRALQREIAQGSVHYSENCAACHGSNLEGEPNWRDPNENGVYPAPPHNNNGHTWHHSDQLIFDYIKLGGEAALAQEGVESFKSGMPAFSEALSNDEIWLVLNFIKSTWSVESSAAQQERTQLENEVTN